MGNIFFCSDHHFHHYNILRFKRDDGSPLRQFSNIEEMNEHIVCQHNSVVNKRDKVYFLGDITMGTRSADLEILARMNGEKVLVKGNHDLCKAAQYLQYFKDIRGTHQFSGIILSHIPLHSDSLGRWKLNVHGHLHHRRVMNSGQVDSRYLCVSMENLKDYTPISLSQVLEKIT